MILVTGATGATGGALLRRLSASNIPTRAMVRDPARAADLDALTGVERVIGDFDEPDELAGVLEGVDRAYLVTNSTERAEDQQIAFIAAARQAGVKHIVKLSQYGADASSPVRFLRYHAKVEEALQASGVAWTILRPNLFMQGILLLAASVREQGRLYAPAGEARISMVDVSDVAEAAFAALTGQGHQGRRYDLTGPEALTFHDVAHVLTEVTGRQIDYSDIPGSALGEMLASAGTPSWQIEGVMEDFEHYRSGAAEIVADGVLTATGREPGGFEDFAYAAATTFRPANS